MQRIGCADRCLLTLGANGRQKRYEMPSNGDSERTGRHETCRNGWGRNKHWGYFLSLKNCLATTLLTVVAVVSASFWVDVGETMRAQGDDDGFARFVGTWQLESWRDTLADGTSRSNAHSEAYLIYSRPRHMCFMGMDPTRPEWVSRFAPTPAELSTTYGGMIAYCAQVEINAAGGYALHHIGIDNVPNSIGMTRKRMFEFLGPDRLVLEVDPAELPEAIVGMTLIWRRVND